MKRLLSLYNAIIPEDTKPRIYLFFLAIPVKLAASALSGVGFVCSSAVCYLAGTLVWVLWLCMLLVFCYPQADRKMLAHIQWMRPAAATTCLVLLAAGLSLAVIIPLNVLRDDSSGHEESTFIQLAHAFDKVFAYNDATALTHQAADNFNKGLNPYKESNIIEAMIRFEGSSDKLTPLRKGVFEEDFPYPGLEKIEAYWQEIVLTPEVVPDAVVSVYGYPSASFIIPALFIKAGITDIRLVFLILTAGALAVVVWITPLNRRIILLLAVLCSLELTNSIGAGETGFLYFPLLLFGWVLIKKQWLLSAVFMGIALAVKQVTWFILPFYLILTWRNAGIRRLSLVVLVNLSVFLSFNIVYMIDDFNLWAGSIFSPMSQQMFPLGVGFVTLVTSGVLDIDMPQFFTLMECAVWLACIAWYFKKAATYPLAGPVLGVLALFFAWRSLWPYFFYVDIIALGCLLIWNKSGRNSITPAIQNG